MRWTEMRAVWLWVWLCATGGAAVGQDIPVTEVLRLDLRSGSGARSAESLGGAVPGGGDAPAGLAPGGKGSDDAAGTEHDGGNASGVIVDPVDPDAVLAANPTVLGAPVAPPGPVPPEIGATGDSLRETEPNNALTEATPLPLGAAVTAHMAPRGDVDHYAVTLGRPGQLRVVFPEVPAEVNIAFRILTQNGDEVWRWQTAPTTGAPFEGWADLKFGGDYVIEVRDGNNNASSPRPYAMTTHFTPAADLAEPNDTFDVAGAIGWNQAILANILPIGDADHYAFDVERRGQLSVAFPTVPPELNMAFRVLTATGDEVAGWQTAPSAGHIMSGIADVPGPGPYVIEVRDGNNNGRSAAPYEMFASFNPVFDPAEPNEAVATATPLPFGQQVYANILPRGDVDHYKVEIAHQGELTVDFNRAPEELNMAFRVLNAAGDEVARWQTSPSAGAPFAGWVDLAAPGTYVIEVRDGNNNARSPDPYGLLASFIPTPDPAEPNDDVTSATQLGFGDPMSASILPRGDVDHYAVDVAGRGQLSVAFTDSPEALNMAFRVLNDRGDEVWRWQTASAAGADMEGWADLAAGGRYVIEVRDGNNNARAVEPYHLTARLTLAADAVTEPNDATETAVTLASGEPIRANILPIGEADMYAFEAPGYGVTVAFPAMPEALNMAFRVFDAGGAEVVRWHTAPVTGAAWEAAVELPGPGRYVMEVRDGNNNARSADPYTLIVTPL